MDSLLCSFLPAPHSQFIDCSRVKAPGISCCVAALRCVVLGCLNRKNREKKDLFSLNPINQCRKNESESVLCALIDVRCYFSHLSRYECVESIKQILKCLLWEVCHCAWMNRDWIDVCCAHSSLIHFDHPLTAGIEIVIGFFASGETMEIHCFLFYTAYMPCALPEKLISLSRLKRVNNIDQWRDYHR